MSTKFSVRVTIEDVLHELSVPAQDFLVDQLRIRVGLQRCRLVCKAFRNLINGCARQMKLDLQPVHKRLLEAGHLPPEFPRCRTLVITLKSVNGWSSETYCTLLMLIIRKMPANAQRRITSLSVTVGYPFSAPYFAFAAVLSCFPELRQVHLESMIRWRSEKLQLELMYDTLKAMASLEELTVPGLDFVTRLDAAAAPAARLASAGARAGAPGDIRAAKNCNSLKHLSVNGFDSCRLTDDVALRLSCLSQLVSLNVSDCRDMSGLPFLLDHVPQRLEELVLPECSLTLHAGTVSTVCVDLCDASNLGGRWAADLLHCRALGPRLSQVTFRRINVGDKRPHDTDALIALLGRSDAVNVCSVDLDEDAGEDALLDALRVVGAWPGRVGFILRDRDLCALDVPWRGRRFVPALSPPALLPPLPLTLQPSQRQGQEVAMPTDGAEQPPGHEAAASLMLQPSSPGIQPQDQQARQPPQHQHGAARELEDAEGEGGTDDDDEEGDEEDEPESEESIFLRGLISRFLATACAAGTRAGPSGTTSSSSYSGAVSTAISNDGPNTSSCGFMPAAMLLRGPLVARLVPEPNGLDGWLRGVRDTVIEAALRGKYGQGTEVDGSYVAFPDEGLVLVAFSDPRVAAAFAALATRYQRLQGPQAVQSVRIPAVQPESGILGPDQQSAFEVLLSVLEPAYVWLWEQLCSQVMSAGAETGALASSGGRPCGADRRDRSSERGAGNGIDDRRAVGALLRMRWMPPRDA